MSRLWALARALLLASLVPLIAASVALTLPVRNPGVQECGSPAAFLVTGRTDARLPRPGDAEFTTATPDLALQRTCTARVDDRLVLAAWAGGVFVVLAATGAVVGLVDDRRGLHQAPRFESLLRERPAGAPGRVWDRPVIPGDDLGRMLPEVEGRDVAGLVVGGVGVWVLLAVVAGWSDTLAAVRSIDGPVLVMIALAVAVMFVAASSQLLSLTRDSASVPLAGPEVVGKRTPKTTASGAIRVTLATAWAARLRPAFAWSGVWLHRLIQRGTPRDRALFEVSTIATAGVSVQTVLAAGAILAFLAGVGGTGQLPSRGWVVVLVALVLVMWGTATSRARYRELFAPPGRAGLRALRALARTDVVRLVGLLGSALVLVLADVAVAAGAVVLVGGHLSTVATAVTVILARSIGTLGPVGNGLGLTEIVFVVLLWRSGVDAPIAVAAGLWWRLATFWLPMAPGLLASRLSNPSSG